MIKELFTKDNFRIWFKNYLLVMAVYSAIILILNIMNSNITYGDDGFSWVGGLQDFLKSIATSLGTIALKFITFLPSALFIFFGLIISGKIFLKFDITNPVVVDKVPYWALGAIYIPIRMLVVRMINSPYISWHTIANKSTSISSLLIENSYLWFIALEYYVMGYLIWMSVYDNFILPKIADES